jgi:hypothetical protein
MADANSPPPAQSPPTDVELTTGPAASAPMARPIATPPEAPVRPPWPEPDDTPDSPASFVAATGVVSTLGADSPAASQPSAPRSTLVAEPVVAAPANFDPADSDPHLVDISPVIREAPPWLISAVVHMLLLIVFGLLFAASTKETRLTLDVAYTEEIGEQLLEDNLEIATDDFELDEQVITPEELPEVVDPLATPVITEIAPLPTESTAMEIPTTIGMALTGRTEGRKDALLKKFGGTSATEGAVALGLKWLARQQRPNGLWSLSGPYGDGARTENFDAATAMALLAFQGAGHTHLGSYSQPFQKVVADGWGALLKRQQLDGSFFDDGPDQHRFYTHAQCSIALCELYGMTGDKSLRKPAQAAIDYLVQTQQPAGGWKYTPDYGNDLSVTGWVVMALQSARMAGLEVPSETLERIRLFLDSVSKDDGRTYAYEPRLGPGLAMTAEGLLCRQYLGWRHTDPRLQGGVDLLVDNLPNWNRGERNVYYWYYATQVCHHMHGHWWEEWNGAMRQMLPANQEQRGRERGSWDPTGDRWGSNGGRLYTTCLSIYILEVYYRHLPIYDNRLINEM